MDNIAADTVLENQMPKGKCHNREKNYGDDEQLYRLLFVVVDQEPASSCTASKPKDHSPARVSVNAVGIGKATSKDSSPARLSVKGNNAKTMKSKEPSPARASVKSLQTSNAGKNSLKPIIQTKYGFN